MTKKLAPSGIDPYQIYELAMACASALLIPSGTSMPADHDRSIPFIITDYSWFSSLAKDSPVKQQFNNFKDSFFKSDLRLASGKVQLHFEPHAAGADHLSVLLGPRCGNGSRRSNCQFY